jgi:4-hydroxythreonine-4-phosphate dehydrogenase
VTPPRPAIGITLGDPAGIGPELVARALCDRSPTAPDVIVFGDGAVLARAAKTLGVLPSGFQLVEPFRLSSCVPGQPTAETGRAQVAYLEAAVAVARSGGLRALVTGPIHKASCIAAGFGFAGHTEFLADRLAAGEVTMMLAGPRLRVSLSTTHLPLRDVAVRLSAAAIERAIVHTAESLARDFGVARPRVAVAALNPHAGEGGHFGDEEARIIAPAIDAARARLPRSVTVSGPHVPDAVFRQAAAAPIGEGRYDAVVAMYHDQGLSPLKVIDFDEAVNVTLGLPIVRTSPDHGVAYDLAGLPPGVAPSARARPASFRAALSLADTLSKRRFSPSK